MDAAGTLHAEFIGRRIAVLRRFRFQFAPWRQLDRAFENTQSPASARTVQQTLPGLASRRMLPRDLDGSWPGTRLDADQPSRLATS